MSAKFVSVLKAVGATLAVVGMLGGSYIAILHDARAEARAEVAPWAKRVEIVEAQQKEVRTEVRSDLANLNDVVHELAGDVRAVYKAVMSGQPQPRLERPLDAGVP